MATVDRRGRVAAEEAGRADLVVRRLTGKSRAEVRGLFDHHCVSINGQPCGEAGTPVAEGDRIEVRFDPHTRYHEKAKPRADAAFRVVFEDAHLIVVDKSAKVLTVPTERSQSKTLVDAVSRYLSHGRRAVRALVVHRLDRGTSGLLVMAKSSAVAGRLQTELRSRKLEREYLAVVAGHVADDSGTIESRLDTDKSLNRFSRDEDDEDEGGQIAVTHFEVVHRPKGATALRVRLETGRRHQIRIHFAEKGHPVLGDRRYRPDQSYHAWWVAGRLALHAAKLAFRHPITGQILRFESPPPAEFQRFLPVAAKGHRRPPKAIRPES